MTRKMILLDLALVAVVGVLIWQLRHEWIDAHARSQALLSAKAKPVPANRLAPLPKVSPLTAASYLEVADMNLFSKDRNPQVIVDVEAPKPKPVPPFPVARGVLLWDGTPPTVLLATRPGAPQRAYRAGDHIGEWTVVSIDNQYVVFSWDGQEFKKRIDEIMDRSAQIAEVAQPAAAAAAAPTPAGQGNTQVKSLGGGDPSSPPGVDVNASDQRGCTPGDDSPAGTVQGGFKKVISQTPFGKSCRWEQQK